MTTPEFLGALSVTLAQLTLPALYAIYKGQSVSIRIDLGPRNVFRDETDGLVDARCHRPSL